MMSDGNENNLDSVFELADRADDHLDATAEVRDLTQRLRSENPERSAEWDAKTAQVVAKARTLKAVRQLKGLTQTDLAEQLGVSQAEVSRMEQRENPSLKVLARYLETLGGRLQISAVFDDQQVELHIGPNRQEPEPV